MQKKILFGKEARDQIQNGVNKVADAVASTLGPRGKNVVISRSLPSQDGMRYYQPIVTRDGITVARNITLDDYLENVGCMMVKEASQKTMDLCGDGTSSTVVLARAIVNEGLKMIDEGANSQQLKTEVDEAVAIVVEKLKKSAIPVSDDVEKIRQIATVSANNDPFIGNLIAEAFAKIGSSGVITIEESKSTKTDIKVISGYQFDRGWEGVSPYFITNHARQECEFENPYILLYDKKLYQLKPLENLINLILSESKPMLIICDDAEGEALAALAMNNIKGTIRVCIVKSPGFADAKRREMEDLAVLTGATYVSDEKGTSLASTTLKHLGKASKVIVGKDDTIIIGGKGKKEDIDVLLNDLKDNLISADESEKEIIEKRIAKLTGGVAVLYVGAPTETEMRERKDRCDDAIRATKSAVAEGYTIGSGAAFIKIRAEILEERPTLTGGMKLILSALDAPLKQICLNAEVDVKDIMPKLVSRETIGYNAKTNKIENLIESGVIDPIKVLRCSIENASSMATMLLISQCLIVDSL